MTTKIDAKFMAEKKIGPFKFGFIYFRSLDSKKDTLGELVPPKSWYMFDWDCSRQGIIFYRRGEDNVELKGLNEIYIVESREGLKEY